VGNIDSTRPFFIQQQEDFASGSNPTLHVPYVFKVGVGMACLLDFYSPIEKMLFGLKSFGYLKSKRVDCLGFLLSNIVAISSLIKSIRCV